MFRTSDLYRYCHLTVSRPAGVTSETSTISSPYWTSPYWTIMLAMASASLSYRRRDDWPGQDGTDSTTGYGRRRDMDHPTVKLGGCLQQRNRQSPCLPAGDARQPGVHANNSDDAFADEPYKEKLRTAVSKGTT